MRIALLIQYDGSDYHGWQVQVDQPTIQGTLEEALEKLYGSPVGLTGSGRTDSGVHALGQVAHYTVDHSAVPPENVWMALNQMLPKDIHILASAEVVDDFHSRFDARERTYQYRITLEQNVLMRNARWFVRFPLQFEKLEACCALILGKHDFSSFCYAGTETKNMICEIQEATWTTGFDGELMFQIKANRFLHHMVRMLVGSMVEVARGKWTLEDFRKLLEVPDLQAHAVTASAKGLALVNVAYPSDKQPDWTAKQVHVARKPQRV